MILTRQPQGGFDAVGSAGCKERAAHAVGGEEFAQLERQLYGGVVRCAAEGGVIGQLVELGGDRVFDRLARITKVDVPQTADAVDNV